MALFAPGRHPGSGDLSSSSRGQLLLLALLVGGALLLAGGDVYWARVQAADDDSALVGQEHGGGEPGDGSSGEDEGRPQLAGGSLQKGSGLADSQPGGLPSERAGGIPGTPPVALEEAERPGERAAVPRVAAGLSAHPAARGTHGGGLNLYTSPALYEFEEQEDVDGEYSAFLGVFSTVGPVGAKRRRACRYTWVPGTEAALLAFEADFNVKLRFVVGRGSKDKEEAVAEEEAEFGEMVHVNVIEEYDNLKLKMMRFFTTLPRLFSARYYLKVDDDIYFRPDRIPYAATQWAANGADYIGCKRRGGTMFAEPTARYFDPHGHMVHDQKYFLYMAGPAYAVSRWAAHLLGSIPERGLRFWGGGDVSFGAWFLALNVQHWDDSRLCASSCNATNLVGYWDISRCNGVCQPETSLLRLHRDACGTNPLIPRGKLLLPENSQSYDASLEKCHTIRKAVLDHKECRKVDPKKQPPSKPSPPPPNSKPPPPPPTKGQPPLSPRKGQPPSAR